MSTITSTGEITENALSGSGEGLQWGNHPQAIEQRIDT